MVRRTITLIASVLLVSAANNVEDTCDANDPDCDVADVSLAQLRLRSHTAKTNQTSMPFSGSSNGPTRNAACFAIATGKCDGGSSYCGSHQGCFEGRCACENGCAGPNGCYQEGNKIILHKFTLTNAMRTNKMMYMKQFSTNGQINTVEHGWEWSKFGGEETEFNLYELPPGGSSQGQSRRYLLVSEEWPDWAITTQPTEGYQPYMFVAARVSQTQSLADIALVVCDMTSKGYPGQIAIGGTHNGDAIGYSWATVFSSGSNSVGEAVWANMNAPSTYVYGTRGNPGPAGRWKVSKDVPEDALPSC